MRLDFHIVYKCEHSFIWDAFLAQMVVSPFTWPPFRLFALDLYTRPCQETSYSLSLAAPFKGLAPHGTSRTQPFAPLVFIGENPSVLSVGAATISDIHRLEERGTAMGVFFGVRQLSLYLPYCMNRAKRWSSGHSIRANILTCHWWIYGNIRFMACNAVVSICHGLRGLHIGRHFSSGNKPSWHERYRHAYCTRGKRGIGSSSQVTKMAVCVVESLQVVDFVKGTCCLTGGEHARVHLIR